MELFVVGFGPGSYEMMTIEAKNAIENSEIIVGYTTYVNILKPYFPEKEYYDTGMKREVLRVKEAVRFAAEGKKVSLVCSGDSGVYGMAELAIREAAKVNGVTVKVIPGVTAALSGGAILGAPLTHDFAVISLSDLLTPWEKIEKRIECAAMADMSIVLYNPSSKKRADYLEKACDIMLKHISPETVCGFVKNIGREEEEPCVLTLKELRDTKVDMFTTVFIGNSTTFVVDGKMVTPRGYKDE